MTTDTKQNIHSQRRNAQGRLLPKVIDTPMKPILDALNLSLKSIRERHPEVPNVVLVIGPSSQKNYGHFAPNSWEGKQATHEIVLNGEGLLRGAEATLGTLIHECAHALAYYRDIKDTSRQHRFHNEKFRFLAEELGVKVEHDKSIGWSITTLPPEAAKLYKVELAALRKALKTFRLASGPKPVRKSNMVKLVTASGRSLRVPLKFYQEGDIVDDETNERFELEPQQSVELEAL